MWSAVRKKKKKKCAKLLRCEGSKNDMEQDVRLNKKQVGALRTRGSRRTEASTSGFRGWVGNVRAFGGGRTDERAETKRDEAFARSL